jgi:hypothetical protein
VVEEAGGGVGLAVPGDPGRQVEEPNDGEASQR